MSARDPEEDKNRGLFANKYEVSFPGKGNVPKLDSNDDYTIL